MRKNWVLAGAAILVAVSATGGAVVMSGAEQATAAAQGPPVNTATVERGRLSDMVSQYGTLTYRARSDGSPYAVINRAHGIYTELPDDGEHRLGMTEVVRGHFGKALNLAEVLFAFQLTGPQERKTVDGWIADKGIDDEDIAGMLPKLEACKQALAHGVGRVRILPAAQVDVLPEFYVSRIDAGTEVMVQ